jgi:hypothetical protein
MGSKFFGVLIAVLAIWLGWVLYGYWTETKDDKTNTGPAIPSRVVKPQDLGELPSKLEEELAAAQLEGASGLKNFLTKYQRHKDLKDPRKAWIQLDYVLLVSLKDPGEARTVFREVKKRVGPDSPVYERVKKMQGNYE